MMDVPVLLITYNRKDNALKVLKKLKEAGVSTLYVACDGAKDNEKDKEKVKKTREAIQNAIDWRCNVKYRFSEKNQGCKFGPVNAIDWVFGQEEYAIILEDDIIPNNTFFPFCKELLERFKNEEEIMMVSGCNITGKTESSEESYFFEPIATTWGWATWKRAWVKYDLTMQGWEEMKKKKILKKLFLRDTAFSLKRDFENVAVNDTDIWDYQWQYTMINNKGYGIVPKYCMVQNVGFGDAEATHTNEMKFKYQDFPMPFPLKYPNEIKGNREYERYIEKQIYRVNYLHLFIKKVLPERAVRIIREKRKNG